MLQTHELQTEVWKAGSSYVTLKSMAQVCNICLAHRFRLNFASARVTKDFDLLPSSSFLPYAFLFEFFYCS